jgi:hypothetical protein
MTMRRSTLGRHARGLALALSATAAMAWACPNARADEPGPDTLPITIVNMQTDSADEQAAALSKALRGAVRAMPGWSLGEGDYSLEVLTGTLKCTDPPDSTCESRIADQIKADRYIWGIVNKKGAEVIGEMHLWVRGKGTNKIDVRYSANLTEANDEALKKVAAEMLTQLTGGPPKGAVHIKAGDVAGQVFVDGTPIGALSAGEGTFPLGSGPHKIVVKAPGYSDVEASVVVKPNATAEVPLTLIAAEAPSNIDYKRIGGFVGIGAGVAFGVVGLVSSLQVNGIRTDEKWEAYRTQYPNESDVCAIARGEATPKTTVAQPGAASAAEAADMCDKAGTLEILQVVFYGLAAVSAGVGVYLIATSGTSEAPTTGLTIQPRISKTAGSLGLNYRW